LVSWFDNSQIFSLKLQNINKQQPNEEAVSDAPIKQKEILRARVTQQAN
jgi:hypothetical protein